MSTSVDAVLAGEVQLTIKAAAKSGRSFSGIASTPTIDSHGEMVDPLGLTFANPVPLLLNHDQRIPVGTVTFQRATAAGLPFTAAIPEVTEIGSLKDLCDLAAHMVAHGLIRNVSVGMITKAVEPIKQGLRILKAEIRELSLVSVPANLDAAILSVKSASAHAATPAASGLAVRLRDKDAPIMSEKTFIPDALKETENHRAATVARMDELMTKAHEAGTTLEGDEADEYDRLDVDLEKTDLHLQRLKKLEASNVAAATPITAIRSVKSASDLRGAVPHVAIKSNLPKGTAATRMIMAIAEARGEYGRAVAIAEKKWNDTTPEVALALKAAVAAGNTTDPSWAGPLVQQNILGDFIELLRPATIIGKIPGMRYVPFNTKVALQTLAGVYGWVGQGAAKPLTKLGWGTVSLGVSKAAGIITLTEELVRLSSPSAEEACRRDMIAGIAAFLDEQFINPAVALVPDVHPASITNGAHSAVATVNAWGDIANMIALFIANKVPLTNAVLIMSEANAFALGVSTNPLGAPQFPSMGPTGGTLPGGIKVVTSQTAAGLVILVAADEILIADEGQVNIDISREASVQMDSAPANPADATTVLVSLWQNNLVGLRAERFINWVRARPVSVEYLTGAAWTPTMASPFAMGQAGGAYVPPPAGRAKAGE